jgi:hypothetical protein
LVVSPIHSPLGDIKVLSRLEQPSASVQRRKMVQETTLVYRFDGGGFLRGGRHEGTWTYGGNLVCLKIIFVGGASFCMLFDSNL